jgi:hypothetical protein
MAAGVTLGFDQAPPTAQLGFAVVQANALFLSATGGAALPQAATPTFSPAAGSYSGTQTVTISDSTTGSSIYLTTDGTTPTYPITGSTRLYSAPITVSASETIKAIAIATGYTTSAVGSAAYVIGSGGTNYLGTNLNGVTYYSSQLPFLNALKMNSNNSPAYPALSGFSTSPTGYGSGDLVVDSDGYPTSMTGSSGTVYTGLSGGAFTNVNNGSAGTPPGQTLNYPLGASNQYRFQYTGAGTILFSGDVTAISSSSSGTTVSGKQITSTGTGVVNVTLTISESSQGIGFNITAIPSNSNYPKAMSLVQSEYTSNYDSGEIFHPLFKASLYPYSRLRFMDWLQTNNTLGIISFTASLAQGFSGNATIGFLGYQFGGASTWPLPTGTYNLVFANGQVIPCGCTLGSATVNITVALTSAVPLVEYYDAMAWLPALTTWSTRCLPSNYSWASVKGVPLEVCWALCNELSVDAWTCFPAGSDSTYIAGAAALCHTGSGSGITSFTGLNSSQKAYIEWSNEVWNPSWQQFSYAHIYGGIEFPSSSYVPFQEWYGVQVYNQGVAWQTEYGSAYSARVINVMGAQTASGQGLTYLESALNAPDWVALGNPAPSTVVQAIAPFAYYYNDFSSADITAILALSTQALQLDEFYSLMYSNVGQQTGRTYTGYSSTGVLGSTAIATLISQVRGSGQSWANLPMHGYETGASLFYSSMGNSFAALMYAAHRDSRMQLAYYDPSSLMYSTYGYTNSAGKTGFLPQIAAAGLADFNHFNDCTTLTISGDWGGLESVMQTISPLSSAPPKFQALANWAAA